MRTIILLPAFFVVIISLIGCSSESSSVAVISKDSKSLSVENGEVFEPVEIPPDSTEIVIWRCSLSGGYTIFVLENERTKYCHRFPFIDYVKPEADRSTIQSVVEDIYPGYKITQILRGTKYYDNVFYVSIARNIQEHQ